VIVKKIATSKAAPPKSKALHVRDLIDYIAGPHAGGDGEKVEHRGALNLLNIDHAAQVEEMSELAETAGHSPQPVQHWILSWREGEQPTSAQADEAVRMFLGEMGLEKHQAVYALHRDTHNWHLHLAVNRVDPETEKLVTVNNRFDHEIAHRAVARIEQRQRWEPEAHALYGPDARGEIARVRDRDATERQPSGKARDFEERAAERSAERVAIEEAAPVVRQANTWRELHAALAKRAMRFEKKGSGALLWIGEQPVKASAAGRDCSMSALQKRLGAFEPAPTRPAPTRIPPLPLDPTAPRVTAYLEQRRQHYEARSDRARMAERHREEWRELVERQRAERAEILRGSWRGKGDLMNALRSLTAARQAQEKAEIRDRQKMERAAQRERFPSYEEWLRRTDRDAGDEWRHRERRPPTIEGPTHEQPVPQDIRAFRAIVDGATVHYHRTGSRAERAFTDRGESIDIHDGRTRESVLAALQLSAQKWGTFVVRGNEEFKRTCVELAAEHGFRIANPELQQAIAAGRETLQPMQAPVHTGPATEPRIHSMTPAAIYQKHLNGIIREQPGRRADPSRLDAEVAVRMAVTEHSREQIAKAVRDGARALRRDDKRDWDAYGRRAAEFAFSPPGRQMRERFVGERERLIRLEGRDHENALLRRLGGPPRYL
jgi:hypothetical protein